MYSLDDGPDSLGGLLEQDCPGLRRRIVLAATAGQIPSSAPRDDGTPDPAGLGVEAGAVLIVEDDALVAFQIEDALEEDGFTICGVSATARGGLALFHGRRPEFAILDVRLAEGDGRDVARQIAAVSPQTIILMCTAEDEDNLQGIGAHALLRKPFDFQCVGAALVATRCWSRGEWVVKAPPQLVRLQPGRPRGSHDPDGV